MKGLKGDLEYNVREGIYDPRKPFDRLKPSDADPRAERAVYLAPRKELHPGPLVLELLERVHAIIPMHEHNTLHFTVRVQHFEPLDFPKQTPPSWHTDYAHSFTRAARLSCHSYALITAGPKTQFLQESNLVLPPGPPVLFERYLQEAQATIFEIEPWRFYAFNATELHSARTATESGWRLFFRATYDPFHR